MKWLTLTFLIVGSTASADHELAGRDVVIGRSLYVDHCASCHGLDLEGQQDWQSPNEDGVLPAPPHDATGHTWHHDNTLLFEYTNLGGKGALALRGVTEFNSGMPAFADVITDDDIWTILAYIRSTWPKREQQIQADRNQSHK